MFSMHLRVCLALIYQAAGTLGLANVRPPPANRTFNSSLVNYVVETLGKSILPHDLGILFSNCLPNTLDTTVLHAGADETTFGSSLDTFVVTGDIPALWLRDSMNQVLPYIALLNASIQAGRPDVALEKLLHGLLLRQTNSVLVDAYSNAFAWLGTRGQASPNRGDATLKRFEPGGGEINAMQDPRLYERKFEVDSLLAVLKLASSLYELAPGTMARAFLENPSVIPALERILDTLEEMTHCNSKAYTFQRQSKEPIDSLLHGLGSPCKDTGMVRTHFRPSDDSVVYSFNIPGNAMAAVELARLQPLLTKLRREAFLGHRRFPWAASLPKLQRLSATLEASVRHGLAKHGTMQFNGEKVFAYEVDGFGNAIFMDDANIPSLLSLPLLGFLEASDPVYQTTRRLLLSEHNPWYFEGSLGIAGIGGPHEGIDMIWPMSLIVQAWTSHDVQEVSSLLRQLIQTSVPNSLMHESFDKNDFTKFTRPWFAWANTLFGHLVLKVATDPVLYPAANLSQRVDLVALLRKRTDELRPIIV